MSKISLAGKGPSNLPVLRRAAGVVSMAVTAALLNSTNALAVDYASSVIATGLNNPRGLAFAPDGSLFIAEAGIPAGSGPSTIVRGAPNIYTETGSITRYFNGTQARILSALPSIYATDTLETVGPNGVTFGPDGRLYVTIGAGVNPAVRATDLAPNGVRLG